MHLTIVLREEVENEQTAQAHFDIVKAKLDEYPDIEVSGQVNTTLPLE